MFMNSDVGHQYSSGLHVKGLLGIWATDSVRKKNRTVYLKTLMNGLKNDHKQ